MLILKGLIQEALPGESGHSDVVFDLFIETHFFSQLIAFIIYSLKTFLGFQVSVDQSHLTSCQD